MKYEDLKIDLRGVHNIIAKRFPNKDLITLEELIKDYMDLIDMIGDLEAWLLTEIRYGSSESEEHFIEVHEKLLELKRGI